MSQEDCSPEAAEAAKSSSPFHVALNGGWIRLMDAMRVEEFVFMVNGEAVQTKIWEAVLISAKVHAMWRSSIESHVFHINDDSITSDVFMRFLEFSRSRVWKRLTKEEQSGFISICQLLGNEELTFLLLDYPARNATEDWSSEESHPISIVGFDAEHCGSCFHRYSVDLLRHLGKETLHALLNSSSLKLVDENELLDTLMELGDEYYEFWSYVELSFLNDDHLSLFLETLPFDCLTELIWNKVSARLKGVPGEEVRLTRHLWRVKSTIITHCPRILSEFRTMKWNLLYRGSVDGFRASDFHRKCDNQSNTLTLIETTKGFVFGGFTPLAWDSSSGDKSDSSQKSFLFTLKNPRKSAPHAFSMTKSGRTIHCGSSYGPIFGSACDIIVGDSCNASNSSYTVLGTSFVNDTGIAGTQVFTGEQYFTVKEIEVFALISEMNSSDECC
jgi:hypothetical protein